MTHVPRPALRVALLAVLLVPIAALGSLFSPVQPVRAAPTSFIVTTIADDTSDANCAAARCTLRQAINASNANDPGSGAANAISFAAGVTGTIALGSGAGFGTLDLARSVAVTGPGVGALTISGGGAVRVFRAPSLGAQTTLRHLAVSGGYATGASRVDGSGGGFELLFGTLTVVDCLFLGNGAPGYAGGAIAALAGTLVVRDSLFVLNSAVDGGAIYAGANGPGSALVVANSTFSRNTATTGHGGGLDADFANSMIVLGSTIRDNAAPAGNGGGLYNTMIYANLIGTIVSGNAGGDVAGSEIAASVGNVIGGDALLDALNGNAPGATATYAALPGSPAIDAGDDRTCASVAEAGLGGVDQRGVTRTASGAHCDAGAFESRGFAFSAPTGDGQRAFVGAAYASPLAVAVGSPAGEPVAGGRVTFTAPGGGPGVAFGARDGCTVTQAGTVATCAIVGGVATAPPMTANGAAGVVQVTETASGVAAPVIVTAGNTAPVAGIGPGVGGTAGGETATIAGAGFGTDAGRVRVTFGAASDGTVIGVTDTTITVRTPRHVAGSVPVTVSIGGVGSTDKPTFTFAVPAVLPGPQPTAPGVTGPSPLPGQPRPTGSSQPSTPSPLPTGR